MIDSKVIPRAKNIIKLHSLHPESRIITLMTNGEELESWKVKSITEDSNSIVSHHISEAIWECSCKFYTFRGECKHIVAMKLCREKEIYIPSNDENNEENHI